MLSANKSIELADLKRVTDASIHRAGPRYTPSLDPDAPNLQITPLVEAFDALTYSSAFRERVLKLETELREVWARSSKTLSQALSKAGKASALCSDLLRELRTRPAGSRTGLERRLRQTYDKVRTALGIERDFGLPSKACWRILKGHGDPAIGIAPRMAELMDDQITLPDAVTIDVYERIPGVMVEVPVRNFAWESYHSEENRGGSPYYPSPSIVRSLKLRKFGPQVDMVDQHGGLATIYRDFRRESPDSRSRLLYMRVDILEEYLRERRMSLAWINWGEREMDYRVAEGLRNNPEIRAIWGKHAHIHKEFFAYVPTERQAGKVGFRN